MVRDWPKPASVCMFLGLAALVAGAVLPAAAQTPSAEGIASDLQRQITAKNDEIKTLEEEAKKHRAALDEVERAADTLASQVSALERGIKRLDAEIRVTDAKISRTSLEIKALGEGIREKETSIASQRERLGYLVGLLASSDRETPLEIMLKHETLSSFFNAVDNLLGVQDHLQDTLAELRGAREDLKDRKGRAEQKKLELNSLREDLDDQKALQVEERRARTALLQETRNQERRYQELLAEIERKREALQREINSLEAGLKAEVDLSILPAPGSGVLGWPLPEPIFITQHFGRTSFARRGGYNGNGHNGIDLRAANGTPVFSAEQGVVRAVGDTDLACRRASYGRWILVDHPSNLTTLYAHLSLVKVRPGEEVNRGALVGYSGRTGYATGPHLHLSVFARQAVEVGRLTSRVCGRVMTLPLSPFGGYLNPLDYL